MHKKLRRQTYIALAVTFMSISMAGCSSTKKNENIIPTETVTPSQDNEVIEQAEDMKFDGTLITLSDERILVDGKEISKDRSGAVHTGADMIYYESGKDDTYGAGSEKDGHTEEEACKHTVITITKPGTYKVTGTISAGQIVVDLGEDAKKDPEAVVNLVLEDADITCSVAPAILVLNAYECGNKDTETATKEVSTTNAGFNLILADDSNNVLNGSYVAKIYKEGTTEKKYKFDAAVESKISLNINGESKGNGKLTVNADNEGIESGLHMTINGGEITINSCDDAINTNEDGVSVLTINGGTIICDSGNGSEGDGIDSNGFIVQNGGFVIASANAQSPDSGVDSDLGIYLNGGTLLASGNMYDEISNESKQNFMVLSFNQKVTEDKIVLIKDANGNPVQAFQAVNDFTMLVFSSGDLVEGDYTMYLVSEVTGDKNGSIYTNITDYKDAVQLQYTSSMIRGMFGGMGEGNRPNMEPPEALEKPAEGEQSDATWQDGTKKPDGTLPDRMKMPDGEPPEKPADGTLPELPEGMEPLVDGNGPLNKGEKFDDGMITGEASTVFHYSKDTNSFSGISTVDKE
ncbi:MAG: carbohydrate-binding domain-containing protein [Clostridiales bacterium]|nr:carbohydrate-binding domain-containing protein [Clostridiales bacterium]